MYSLTLMNQPLLTPLQSHPSHIFNNQMSGPTFHSQKLFRKLSHSHPEISAPFHAPALPPAQKSREDDLERIKDPDFKIEEENFYRIFTRS